MSRSLLRPRVLGAALVAAVLVWGLVATHGRPRWLVVGVARLGGYQPERLTVTVGLPPGVAAPDVRAAIGDRVASLGFTPAWTGDTLEVAGAGEADLPDVVTTVRTPGRLELRWAIDDDPLMARLVGLVGEYPEGGVEVGDEAWQMGEEGPQASARFVRARSADRLDRFLAWARRTHPDVTMPDDRGLAFELIAPVAGASRAPEPFVRAWMLERAPLIDNADLVSAAAMLDPYTNRPMVEVALTPEAGRRFGDGTASHVGHHLAIKLDHWVTSAPVVFGAIRGGRFVISMGGSDPVAMQRQADDLAAVLRARAPLPAGIEVRATAAEPRRRGWLLDLPPVILALLAGVLVLLGSVPLARLRSLEARYPAARVARRPWPPIGPLAGRVAITVGLVAVMFFAQGIALPGVNEVELLSVLGSSASFSKISIVALGIMPIVSASVLVELAALLTARGRRRRLGGPAARAGMTRATIILAAALALLQGYFIARYLETTDRTGHEVLTSTGWSMRSLMMLTMAAGVMALAVIASLIGRYGVGNGYAVLIVAGVGADVWYAAVAHHDLAPAQLVVAAAGLMAIVVLTGSAVRTTYRGRHRLPLGGIVSMQAATSAAGVIALVSLLFGPSIITVLEYLPPRLAVVPWLLAVVGCGVAGAWIALAVESRRLGAAPPGAGDRAIAIAVSAGYLGLVVVLDRVLRMYLPIDGLAVAGATAIAVDLIAEIVLRAREGGVVAIASLQAVVDADRACAALAEAGIPVACQGLAYRALLRVFAPFVPLDVLVPAALADRARELVSAASEPRPADVA